MSTDTSRKSVRPLASIRTQLWLGFGLILALALIMALIGLFSLQGLRTNAERTLDQASRIRELSFQIDNEFLQARQSEANFLNSWRSDGFEKATSTFVTENQGHLIQARQALAEIEALIAKAPDQELQQMLAETDDLAPLFDAYEAAFLTTVDKIEERSQATGLEQTLSDQLGTLEDEVAQLSRKDLFELVLRIRNNERAFFVDNRPEYGDNVRLLANQFTKIVEESSTVELTAGDRPLSRQMLVEQLNAYLASFDQLVILEQDIDVNTTVFGDVTVDINTLTGDLSKEGENGLILAKSQLQSTSNQSIGALIISSFLALAVGIGISILLARRIVTPLTLLSEAAHRLGEGQLDQKAAVPNNDEFAGLADAFNTMADQLLRSIRTLEIRSQSLETIAALSENLSAILDLDELMSEVVRQVQNSFGYYHAHIYLLDDKEVNLVVAAGTGSAGAEMKSSGHSITLQTATSLVARAARTAEIVSVDNVRQAEDWLSNPLLPDTFSEMAVPIILGGRVVGVLDVQEDEVAGLDESDANLLRSLANQVAVAIRNAQLFNQVEASLAEARTLHERYMSQAWDKNQTGSESRQAHFARPEVPAIVEAVVSDLSNEAINRDSPSIISYKNVSDSAIESISQKAIVAPISLRDRKIGAIQVHSSEPGQSWTGDDLAIVEAVTEQLAQMADNLRLFDETRERASRELVIREVTEKMRAATSLEALVKTAGQELGRHLSAGHALVELGLDGEPPATGPQTNEQNGTQPEVVS